MKFDDFNILILNKVDLSLSSECEFVNVEHQRRCLITVVTVNNYVADHINNIVILIFFVMTHHTL